MSAIVDELVAASAELDTVQASLEAQMDKLFAKIMATKGDMTQIAKIRDDVKADVARQREALLRNTEDTEEPPVPEPNPNPEPGPAGQRGR